MVDDGVDVVNHIAIAVAAVAVVWWLISHAILAGGRGDRRQSHDR